MDKLQSQCVVEIQMQSDVLSLITLYCGQSLWPKYWLTDRKTMLLFVCLFGCDAHNSYVHCVEKIKTYCLYLNSELYFLNFYSVHSLLYNNLRSAVPYLLKPQL